MNSKHSLFCFSFPYFFWRLLYKTCDCIPKVHFEAHFVKTVIAVQGALKNTIESIDDDQIYC